MTKQQRDSQSEPRVSADMQPLEEKIPGVEQVDLSEESLQSSLLSFTEMWDRPRPPKRYSSGAIQVHAITRHLLRFRVFLATTNKKCYNSAPASRKI